MEKFKAFQQKITMSGESFKESKAKVNEEYDVTGYHGQILDSGDDNNWLKTKFKCKKHMDQDAKTGGDG